MPHKGLDVAIQAFAGIAPEDALLHVWGSSDDAAYVARIVDLASRTPAARLHGALPEPDKLDRLRDLDVLLLPSVGWESFGIVAREAMAEGVPVVASDQSALSELFADGRGGRHVPPGDVAALAAVVREVIGAPETLASWRPDPAGMTSLESHAAAIDDIYGALLSSSRGKPA
jgi:glycosyltransferase involved in cell wall biosynthesis